MAFLIALVGMIAGIVVALVFYIRVKNRKQKRVSIVTPPPTFNNALQ